MTRFYSFPEIRKLIEARSEAIDIASVSSKAEEMHRLLDNARDSLIALLAFCLKIGVTTKSDQNVVVVLNAMLRDEMGKRFVDAVWDGRYTPTDVDHLDLVNASRLGCAKQFGVSEQTVIRFEKMKAGNDSLLQFVGVHCNHPGCSMSKSIGFENPAEMLEAEQRASKEIWYCKHHRELAFLNERALSDDLLGVLQRIAQSPGLTKKAAGAKKEDIEFLQTAGLIRFDQINQGKRILCYQIFITDEGQSFLSKFLN